MIYAYDAGNIGCFHGMTMLPDYIAMSGDRWGKWDWLETGDGCHDRFYMTSLQLGSFLTGCLVDLFSRDCGFTGDVDVACCAIGALPGGNKRFAAIQQAGGKSFLVGEISLYDGNGKASSVLPRKASIDSEQLMGFFHRASGIVRSFHERTAAHAALPLPVALDHKGKQHAIMPGQDVEKFDKFDIANYERVK